MRRPISVLLGAAGLTVVSQGATTVTMLASTDGVNFSSFVLIMPSPGLRTVEILTVVSHTGSPAVGLDSFQFQPTVSNWGSTDSLVPLTTSFGGNTTTPSGVLADAAGQYGRISPWGAVSIASSQRLMGHVNGDSGTTYLRIAQAQATSWIGGTGNTTGGRGVNIKQLNDFGRTASEPAFNSNLSNIHVFRFALQLDTTNWARSLIVDAPGGGFGNFNSGTGEREVFWYADMNEATGSVREVASVSTANIYIGVPSPGSVAVLGLGWLAVSRRRRA